MDVKRVTALLAGVQVLVVDDNDINLELVRRLLGHHGAIVLTATNGRQALERLRREPGHFDAVLMDVLMPEMDGYEATRLIRSELGLTRLPILAFTAGTVAQEHRRAEAAGMNDLLTKPLNALALVSALRRAVEAARGQPLPPMDGAAALVLPTAWPEIEGIDRRDAVLRIGQDADLFLRILGRLLREFAAAPFASELPLDGDREALTARLHKLRGCAGQLGAPDVHRLAGEAESALRAGAMTPDLHPTLAALDQALLRLAQAARPAFAARQPADVPTEPAALDVPAVTAEELAQLRSLLRQQDLSAGPRLQALAPALAAHWGAAHYARVRQACEELDFNAALQLIEHALAATHEAHAARRDHKEQD
jgi:CheY-like chemotaxis protein/HPt (histidine-containing phosphotransfer) domain-containing protein